MNSDQFPASIQAERTILGAILLDGGTLSDIEERIKADDFSVDSHRRIFQRMQDLKSSGSGIDLVTLVHILDKRKETAQIGGVAFLASLTEGLPMRPDVAEYTRIVRDKAVLRRLMALCSSSISRAQDQTETALEILSRLQADLQDVEHATTEAEELESVGQWLATNDVFAERKQGVFTGIDDYDEMTYGLHPGELTVVAARTGVGKTSHACTITWQIAHRGKSVCVMLNEQQKSSFLGRMLCAKAGVGFTAYRRGSLGWVEKQYMEDAVAEFKKFPIFWDARTSMSIASIGFKVRRLKRTEELDVVIVDQLSGVSSEGIYEKGMRSDEVIGLKVLGLKKLAMELNIPVVLYHQLNRASTKSRDGRPSLTDLQDSGKIEQHADNVAFLHRPEYFDHNDETLKGKAEILISKQRDGSVGTVHCEFVDWCCKWSNRKESK